MDRAACRSQPSQAKDAQMDTVTALSELLTVLEEKHYAAVVLIVLFLINKLGPPKG
jgi:uncharacterized protein YejL (UPF0352 family)